MAADTGVDWANYSHPVIAGCSLESPGCINCYAIRDAWRLSHHPNPKVASKYAGLVEKRHGKLVWTGQVNFHAPSLLQPLSWTKPGRIFLTPEGDLFHPEVAIATIDRILAVAALASWHDWLILTKRTARLQLYFADKETPWRIQAAGVALWHAHFNGQLGRVSGRLRESFAATLFRDALPWPLPNFWLVTSIEDQKRADLRREPMRRLAEAGWITGVSYEPALEPGAVAGWDFLDWLVSGNESGAGARWGHPQCHRAARDFCAAHAIAYNFKQWGAWMPAVGQGPWLAEKTKPRIAWVMPSGAEHPAGAGDLDGAGAPGAIPMVRLAKHKTGRLLDGVLHDSYPARAQTTKPPPAAPTSPKPEPAHA